MAVSGKKEVYGGFASVNLRKPDLKQEDPKKGDYIKGKDAYATEIAEMAAKAVIAALPTWTGGSY